MDYIELSVFASRIAAFCDETVAILCRETFSSNGQQGLNVSCAVSNPKGDLRVRAARVSVAPSGLPPASCFPLPA